MALTERQILNWHTLSTELKDIKGEEAKERREICIEIFQGRQGAFTEKVELGPFKIKAVSKVKLGFDEDMEFDDDAYEALSDEAKACITYKPTLSKSALKKLDPKDSLFDYLIESPAMPALSVTKDV